MPVTIDSKKATRAAKPTPANLIGAFHDLITADYQRLRNAAPDQTQADFAACLACSAANFSGWTDGDPWTWRAPEGYEGRLTAAVTWLRGLKPDQRPTARLQALGKLRRTWPPLLTLMKSGAWDTMPRLWLPPEGPYSDQKERYPLPIWDDTPDGRTAADWECYSGALAHLNQALGLTVLDLQEGHA